MSADTGHAMKAKLDEYGVTAVTSSAAEKLTTGSKSIGGYIFGKAKAASSAVNSKIDNNEKLSNARDSTKEKLGLFSQGVKSKWGLLSSKFHKK
jgi:hypothetical protein